MVASAKSFARKKRAKVAKVMREYSKGKLHSGSGGKVKSKRQAVAIALSMARRGR